MKAQLGFYEVEIKKVEQKGFDIGNKFKSELIKSLTTTKALQLKAGQLENATRIIKAKLDEKQLIVEQLSKENIQQSNKINDLSDVISHLESKMKLLK